jgi:CHAT domain-containing protein/tetratricopeptide (TPR) repeat protein
MHLATFRGMLATSLGFSVFMLLGTHAAGAQAAGPPAAPRQEKSPERDRLARRVEELRQAGKLDEALSVAERVLELERQAEGEMTERLAVALSRLAELHELRGDWPEAQARRKEALTVRERVDGVEHWRTADTRLALAFAEKVAGLRDADRAKVRDALRGELVAARLDEQRKYAEAEREAVEALETYQALVGPETADAARMWDRVGRVRWRRNDARGAQDSTMRALAIRRKVLPPIHPGIAENLTSLGIMQSALHDYAAAKTSNEESLAIFRKVLSPGHSRIATSLTSLGTVHANLRQYATAKTNFKEALAIERERLPQGHLRIAVSLMNLGKVQNDLRDYEAAKACFEEAVGIFRTAQVPDYLHVAASVTELGNVQMDLRDYAAAKASYLEALAIYRKTLPAGHLNIAGCLTNLGGAQWYLQEYATVKASHEEALTIRRKALPRDHPDIAQSLTFLGAAQKELGEFKAAKASHEQALTIRRKVRPPGHLDIAVSLSNLGNVQREMGEYAAAKASHEEALDICRRALPASNPNIASCLTRLAIVQMKLGAYAAAKTNFEEALAIDRKALPPGDRAIAASLVNLGNVQSDLGEYETAKATLEEGLAIYRKALPPGHPDIAVGLENLGISQRELREYAAAKASHVEALAICRKALPVGHPRVASILNNLGVAQEHLREYAAAKESHQQALTIRRTALPQGHPDIALSLDNLGSVQQKLREYAAAKASHEEALAICRKSLHKDNPDIAHVLHNLAALALDFDVEVGDAVPRLVEAIDIFQVEHLRLAAAQAEPEQLVAASQARRSLAFLIDATLITGGNFSLAYDRAVSVKGSVTARQRWARKARDTADPESARLLDRLREVTMQIVGLSIGKPRSDQSSDPTDVTNLLRALSGERSRLEQQLAEHSAIYRAVQAQARIGANEVRSALPKGAVLIDVVNYQHREPWEKGQEEPPMEQRLAAFVLRPEREVVAVAPLGSSRSLAELIFRWRASYGAGKSPPAGVPEPGTDLRKRLWEPLAKHLEGVKIVLISPEGPLNGLPWGALPGSKKDTFLIQEYAFAVVPVSQLLPELLRARSTRPSEPASLVVGNIDFDALPGRDREAKRENHFAPLPATAAETAAVHDLFRAAFADRPASILTGKEATKQAFISQAPGCSHLLVATHGFFLPEPKQRQSASPGQQRSLDDLGFSRELVTSNPALRSGLVFAGANYAALGRENAFLTAMEASELDLHRVDLAVLSACETGLGKVEAGEGMLGLQRAFQLAGARTAVTSLWKVPDAATQVLMTRFHGNLWEKHMGKLEALREAQLWMIKEGSKHAELDLRGGLVRPEFKPREGDAVSPFYWAAFILSGDWR